MTRKWLVLHDGQTLGPYTVAQIKELAGQGKILPTDRIWGEGSDPRTAVPAERAVDFSKLPRPAPAAPKKAAPAKGSKKGHSSPRIDPVLFGDTDQTPAKSQPAPKPRKKSPEPVSNPHLKPLPAVPLPQPIQTPVPALEIPPVPLAVGMPPVPAEVEVVPMKAVAMEAVAMEAVAMEAVAMEAVAMEAVMLPPSVAAVHEAGLHINERFRRACAALSQWADREENMSYILAADAEIICAHPEVLQILHPFRDQPFEVMEKLIDHLDLMVQNRSSYYQALARRQGR